MLKRKIIIKNKRLRPEVEKQELELFQKGQFVITDDEVKEDAAAADVPPPIEEKKVFWTFGLSSSASGSSRAPLCFLPLVSHYLLTLCLDTILVGDPVMVYVCPKPASYEYPQL